MTSKQVSFETGTAGNISSSSTTPNPPAGGTDVKFDQVVKTGTGTLTLSTTGAWHGTKCMICGQSDTTSSTSFAILNHPSASVNGRGRFYWQPGTALPTSGTPVIARLYTSVNRIVTIQIQGATKKLQVAVSSSDTVALTASAALVASTEYRFEWALQNNGPTGTLYFAYFTGDSTTPIESWGPLSVNTGTAINIQDERFGRVASSTLPGDWIYDDLYVDDSASTALPGPALTNLPPTANAGPDQINIEPYATVTLDGSGSTDSDGTIASYAWTQTAGTTVALTGASTSGPSFTAPATVAGDTLTFQLTVTDDGGATSTDTVSVTVLSHTMWRLDGSGPSPMRLVSL